MTTRVRLSMKINIVITDVVNDIKYTHGNKLGNTCNNATTNFGLYKSFFVKIMKNVLTTCQNL